MKKKRYLILTTILFLSYIPKTYAACTQEEINEFKKVEAEYKVTYEFNKDTKDYTVTFYNPLPDKYEFIIDGDMNLDNYVTSTENSFTFSSIKTGEYTLEITGVTDTCKENLKTMTVNLPNYNHYSEDPLCEGIEEFVLCQPTYDKEIDYDTFVSRVNTYKKSKETENNEQVEEKKEENKILQYIENNLIQIIIIAVFIILVIITTVITIKTERKSRRLE